MRRAALLPDEDHVFRSGGEMRLRRKNGSEFDASVTATAVLGSEDRVIGAVTVIRPSGRAVEGTRTVTTFSEAGPPPKLVVLAFKPQKLDEIAAELRSRLSSKTVVVSILAGVEAASLRQRFPGARAIVRAMPNLPVAIRRGVTALYSEDADEALKHNGVKEVVLVDIDGRVVELCREHFGGINSKAFRDRRQSVREREAREAEREAVRTAAEQERAERRAAHRLRCVPFSEVPRPIPCARSFPSE